MSRVKIIAYVISYNRVTESIRFEFRARTFLNFSKFEYEEGLTIANDRSRILPEHAESVIFLKRNHHILSM